VHRVCGLLGIAQDASPPTSKLTQAEHVIIEAVDRVCAGLPHDAGQVEASWRVLRKKRYALTLFEHFDPFNPALDALRAALVASEVGNEFPPTGV